MKANWKDQVTGERSAHIKVEFQITHIQIEHAIDILTDTNTIPSYPQTRINRTSVEDHIRYECSERGTVWTDYYGDNYGNQEYTEKMTAAANIGRKLFPEFYTHENGGK